MRLYTTIRSEKGKEVTKGGQEYIEIDITVGKNHTPIGSIYLDYNHDRKDGCDLDEWVLQWKKAGADDGDIIAQGNI